MPRDGQLHGLPHLTLFLSGSLVLGLWPKRRRLGHLHDLPAADCQRGQGRPVGLAARVPPERPPPYGAAAGLRLLGALGTSATVTDVVRFAFSDRQRKVFAPNNDYISAQSKAEYQYLVFGRGKLQGVPRLVCQL